MKNNPSNLKNFVSSPRWMSSFEKYSKSRKHMNEERNTTKRNLLSFDEVYNPRNVLNSDISRSRLHNLKHEKNHRLSKLSNNSKILLILPFKKSLEN